MSSARSVSQAAIPARGERLVELDLLGRHRLDLDDLGRARVPHEPDDDRVRLGRVARPVDDAAGRGDVRLELDEELGQAREDVVLDRGAGEPQRLPVVALGDRPGALRRGSSSSRGAGSRRSCSSASAVARRLGERRRARERRRRRRRRRAVRSRRAAPRRGSRRGACTRTGDRRRAQHARRGGCRHEVSAAVSDLGAAGLDRRPTLSAAHADGRVGVLDGERAAEPAALVGARRGPRARGPRPPRAAAAGRSPIPSSRTEWQVGWNATVCGKRAPTSVTPSTSMRNSRELVAPAARPRPTAARSRVVRRLVRGDRRVMVRGPSPRTTPRA